MIEYLKNNFSEFVLITTKLYIKYVSNTLQGELYNLLSINIFRSLLL